MPYLLQNPITLILAFISIAMLTLYLREYNYRKKMQAESDHFLQEIKEKGWDILHESVKKSTDLLGQAELEGIKVVAQNQIAVNKMDKEYSAGLTQALAESRQNITAAQSSLLQFMQELQKTSAEFEGAQKASGEQRINQLFDGVESRLTDFLIQTEQKTTSSIELELKSARELVEAYKNEQLKMIDENIIAMMEQTLSLVLSKKLSLKDQLDLIYEALERAKAEKFIV